MIPRERPSVTGTRRSFVKTTLYVAPVILSLTATPTFASYGSEAPAAGGTPGIAERLRAWYRAWRD